MIRVGVVTISDTRDLDTDTSGQLVVRALRRSRDIDVTGRVVVRDEAQQIKGAIDTYLQEKADCIITNGGTGISKRDVTFEAIREKIHQELPGFGEIFRMLSFETIGSKAIASRAIAGFTQSDCLLFALPGSTNACDLAMEKLILPELEHLIGEKRKKADI